ncbi:MAG: beta-ketoacyl synthase chain length factor [Victivallaceae bacterium]|nr:beta-ketoacyl synthase chain length factor [Victivallaceae bacterium]
MFIKGIGLISGAGIGLAPLQIADGVIPNLIPDELIKSYKLPRMMRRADRFSRICAVAAKEAVTDAGASPEIMKNSGIMVVSAIGPHRTTFAFLDELLDYPEAEVSPTKFSHSVHNAAASYISILCGINGMSLTITGFDNPWFNALVMAETALQQGSCQQILLVGADENGLLSKLLEANLDKELNRDKFTECAVGMILSNQADADDYCSISTMHNVKADLIVSKGSIKLANGNDTLINNDLPSGMFGNALECIAMAIRANN